MEDVSKRFGELWANRHITLEIFRAEIHAIVGENGAGKSTLMKILFGHMKPDTGRIFLDNVPVVFRSPRDAKRSGIGMVHQQLLIFPQLSALENITVGARGDGRGVRTRQSSPSEKVLDLCRSFGFDLPLDSPASELSFGHRQQIELLRMLYGGARVLILDEPTSLLTPPEVEGLLELLRSLRSRGHMILFISHRLREVFALADRVSVLRRGTLVATFNTSEISAEQIGRLIVGGEEPEARDGREARGELSPSSPPPVLRMRNVTVRHSQQEHGLEDFSLRLQPSEIVGIGGVVGNGQRSLARALAGMTPVERGAIVFAERDITGLGPGARAGMRLRWLPANPWEEALLPARPLWENLLLGRQREAPFHKRGWLSRKTILAWVHEQLEDSEVSYVDASQSLESLSGGNQQKLALARTLALHPRLVVLEQPGRGLDIRARERLRQRIFSLCETGTAFLLISYDLDELLSFSHRIGILYRGRLMGMVETAKASRDALGSWMLGVEQ